MRDKEYRQNTDQQSERIPLSYYNAEHYAEPTTYYALKSIERDQQAQRQADGVPIKKKVLTQVIRYD